MEKIAENIYVYPFEEERDRPALSLICGEKLNLAVDAGHSQQHVREFYAALKDSGLPLPDVTVMTHWHWDHCFGLHAVNGISLAERRTQRHLLEAKNDESFIAHLLGSDEYVAREYQHQQMIISLPDIVFDDVLDIDLGALSAHCFHVVSAHTDDCLCILIPERGVLFLGDCISGAYPDWLIDPAPFARLVKTLENTEFSIAVGSHWPPFDREELLDYLRSQL